MIEKKDYESLLKERLIPLQKASLVNRFFYAKLGNLGYHYLINSLARRDVVERLRGYYNPSFLKSLLYPLAGWRFRSRLIDKGCHDADCTCVWCKCRR
jgi:hypothetical protein